MYNEQSRTMNSRRIHFWIKHAAGRSRNSEMCRMQAGSTVRLPCLDTLRLGRGPLAVGLGREGADASGGEELQGSLHATATGEARHSTPQQRTLTRTPIGTAGSYYAGQK